MKEAKPEADPVAVLEAKRRGETQLEWSFNVRDRWGWVEAAAWTEPMLETLEGGVKGGRWHSLMDKVYAPRNLRAAFERVRKNRGGAGVDHVSVERFAYRLDEELAKLHEDLKSGAYRPQSIKRRWIPKPGTKKERPLGIPTVRDRLVQTALRNVLEPIFEHGFAAHSYGFRPGRSCKDALGRVDELLRQGFTHVVDADIQGYFDAIPHAPLMAMLKRHVADGRVRGLVELFLKQEVLEDTVRWTPEAGSPQGAVISPLLSNIYLDPLDHLMASSGVEMVRYADDLVLVCRDAAQARHALAVLREWMEAASLTLHPDKTRLVDYGAGEGFDFLGYHFKKCKTGHRHWASDKSLKAMRAKLRDKTPRCSGKCLPAIIAELNPIMKGWLAYYQHSRPFALCRLDQFVRRRLRTMLRKRRKRKGRARGTDNQRWPNAYFHKLGLCNLEQTRAKILQSSTR